MSASVGEVSQKRTFRRGELGANRLAGVRDGYCGWCGTFFVVDTDYGPLEWF